MARILILDDLFVVPNARRVGVGTSLLRAAADFGKSVGAVRLTLSTEVTNKDAQGLYEAEGWTLQTDFCVYKKSAWMYGTSHLVLGPLNGLGQDDVKVGRNVVALHRHPARPVKGLQTVSRDL